MVLPLPEAGDHVEEFSRKHRTGVLTLLFTDIVNSTGLKERYGDAEAGALTARHHALLRQLLAQFPPAEEIETAGDSFLLIFVRPSDAVKFALLLQGQVRQLAKETGRPLADRIGIHVGEVFIEDRQGPGKLFGMHVDVCARVMNLAQANQILMTRMVFDNARQLLKGRELGTVGELRWLNHGPYLLKGFEDPIEVCEVGETGQASLAPPATTDKAHRYVSADSEPVLGWRPAVTQKVPGTQWVLGEKLGEGGFGEVWAAVHPAFKEKRVFKFCFRADRVRALKHEVTLFRLLKERAGEHPNIVRLLEVYFDEPPFYLEEEYIAGRDLATWCAAQGGSERVPLEMRLEIVAQAAEGLEAAHDAGVIHRDIKPGNILISHAEFRMPNSTGQSEARNPLGEDFHSTRENQSSKLVKLTDFGIGKVVSDEHVAGATRGGSSETMFATTSSPSGTQLYMAPELLAGKPASTRSDVYSLGMVLYQLLVGDFRRPITTDWQLDIDDPLLRADLQLCFAGNPQDRFAAAGQLARNLRALPVRRAALQQQQAEWDARERAAYRRGIVRAASLAVVVVALLGGFALIARHESRKAEASARRAELEKTEAQRLLYVANLNLAQQAWDQNNISRVQQLLEETAGLSDRDFEWYYWQRQIHLAQRTLYGHLGTITSVAFSRDGQWLLTGSLDQTANLWDPASGRHQLSFRGHTASIESVAFSPDNRRIATAGFDQTARLWDVASGRELLVLRGHSGPIWSVDFSPDGKRIVTGSFDQTAKVWDVVQGRGELLTLKGHSNWIGPVAFSADGLRIVTGSADQTARIWDAVRGRELLSLIGHTAPIRSVAFSPDGRQIITGSMDQSARVWDAATGRELFVLKGHSGPIWSARFSPDGRQIVTGSDDRRVKVWEATGGRELFTLKGHSRPVRSVAFSPDNRVIVTGGGDRTAKLWEASSDRELLTFNGHRAEIWSMAVSPDSQRIVTSADQIAKVWEAGTGRELLTLEGHSAPIWSTAFSSDGQRIVTGSADQTARIWAASNGTPLLTFTGHQAEIWSVAISPDGRRIVTGSADQTARVWETESGRELFTLKGHRAPIWSVAFSWNGQRIVTGSEDQTAKIWDASSGRLLNTLKEHTAPIRSVAFSPDSQRMVTGSWDQTAKVWDVASGRVVLTLKGHSARILSAAFSRNGRRIITGSSDQKAKVWQAATGRELLTLDGHKAPIWAVAFSADGLRIVTASADQTAKVWQAAQTDEVVAWQNEERAASQYVASLQRQRLAQQDRQKTALAHDEGAVKRWLVLAPIALITGQSGAQGLDFEPIASEAKLRPKSGERAVVQGSELMWREVALADYAIDFNAILRRDTARSVAYAVSYIQSESELRGVRMLIGSDDQAKVYLNGRQVHRYPYSRAYLPDQDVADDIVFEAGLNVLLFKVLNESGSWKGSIRFTDATGNPVPGIRVTLNP